MKSLAWSLVLLLIASRAGAWVASGSKWPEPQTTFYPGLSYYGDPYSPSGESWLQAFKDAAAEWSRQTRFQFQVDGSNPSHPCAGLSFDYPEDGFRNGAAFTPYLCSIDPWGYPELVGYGSGTLAVTMTYTEETNGLVTSETDIFFNDNLPWDVYDGPERYAVDFRRVALHELGHALGLGHETYAQAIMQPIVGDLDSLQPDDLAGVAALYGAPDGGTTDDGAPIVLTIEEPAEGAVMAGISNFRGWVVSKDPVQTIELYLDGSYQGELKQQGLRQDVANIYFDYPNALQSGFARAFSYGKLAAGSHRFRVVVVDSRGNRLEKSVQFQVARYDTSYLDDPTRVSVSRAYISGQGTDILVDGLEHDGRRYRLRLRWNTGSQDFDPVEITPLD